MSFHEKHNNLTGYQLLHVIRKFNELFGALKFQKNKCPSNFIGSPFSTNVEQSTPINRYDAYFTGTTVPRPTSMTTYMQRNVQIITQCVQLINKYKQTDHYER